MLAFLGCPGDIVRHERIGRISNNKPAVRPIKVVLRSANDREFILSRTNLLRGDTHYSGTYISRWLSQNDLNKVKILRHRCQDLNKASPADKKRSQTLCGYLWPTDETRRGQQTNES